MAPGLVEAEFRSSREKVVYFSVSHGWVLLFLFSATYMEWLGSVLFAVVFAAGALILHAAVLGIWLSWGRVRFPLRSPDESPAS